MENGICCNSRTARFAWKESTLNRRRFRLNSDQIELLLAFEQCDGLGKLASLMARDQSVVSRNLQRLAETAPVIVKAAGRWRISPLGRQICTKAAAFLCELDELLDIDANEAKPAGPSPFASAALVIINAQRGLLDPVLGGRSTPVAEANIALLLAIFRARSQRVFHIRHISQFVTSPFHAAAQGVAVISGLGPIGEEPTFDKQKASAFTETLFADALESAGVETIVLAGFTANDCIDATARHASELGFKTYVVSDATASFDLRGHDGRLYHAERVHLLTLANLHAHVSAVVEMDEVIKSLNG